MIPVRTSVEVDETPGAVIGLIVANVAVFLVQVGLPDGLRETFIYQYALVPARYTQPEFARELGLDPGNYLPLLTNTFMHGGLAHLTVNMWTLWLFGRALEERLGTLRFIGFYLLCGALASLAHLAFNLYSAVPALGASGAIAGILGGYTLLYPRAKIALLTLVLFFPATFQLPAVVYTAIWFVLQVAQGVAQLAAPEPAGGIAWWAHIGGFLGGVALIMLLGTPQRRARQIGPPRDRQREVGIQRARVIRIGPQRAPVTRIAAARRGKLKLPALGQRRRTVMPARSRESVAPSADTPWETGAPARPSTAQARVGRPGPGSSIDHARRRGRSIIPESGPSPP
ncbi:MAG: rhomboid family intramembrane serine protease [Kiloniellaceae bacterium]